MNCKYCYEQDKTSSYEWDEIKALLDNIVKYNNNFSLEFLGGEPCLRIDLIEKTFHYLESIEGINVEHYMITTNGTIINDSLIELLKNNTKIGWTASMDGTKFANSLRITKQGYNSYDIVVENFKTLKKALDGDKNNQLGVHPVTHPYNIGYLNKSIEDLYNHGFRSFGIGTVESTLVIDKQYCEEFVKQHKILSDRIKNGEFPGISISLFNGLKPKSDSRHYIKDETGKTILETYGRAENDIKDSDGYKTDPSSSPIGDMIYNIREEVYNYHNK
jgi:sulfatase maturation enzyme AslB (radical SAM superfamily)